MGPVGYGAGSDRVGPARDADEKQTRDPIVTRTAAGDRRATTSGARDAAVKLASTTALPLFPQDTDDRGHVQARPRAPLGVRRPTPEIPRPRPGGERRASDPTLRFEAAAPAPPGAAEAAQFAPPMARLAAGLFDAGLLAVLDAVVIVLTLRLAGLDLPSVGELPIPPLTAFLILLDAGYVIVLTAAGGQTFGKMLLGIRVVDRAGAPVTVSAVLVRSIGCLVAVLPLGVGIVWMFLDPERRAPHDRLAGTRVLLATSRA